MKRVTIFCNGLQSGGKTIALSETFEDLLKSSGEKLKISADRIFTASGGEIDDINLVQNDDILYISSGENFIGGTSACSNGWITLNVGGKHFTTSRSNITEKEPLSMLARMFAEENDRYFMNPSSRDPTGAFLIDRSPLYFEPVLNYLRNGQLIFNKDVNPQGILEEARFYGIESMIPQLEWLIQNELSKNTDNAPLTRQDVIKALVMTSTDADLRFQGVNLSGADLNRLDLRNINFKYACLSKCNLKGANLSQCCLERADLSYANLEGAQLLGIKALCANLEGSNLKGCNLENPNGIKALLEGVNLKGANMEGSNMAGVILRVATLKNSNLKNCDLRDAVLAGADLEARDPPVQNVTTFPNEFGFRQGKSTEHAINSMLYTADLSLHKCIVGIFLDIPGSTVHMAFIKRGHHPQIVGNICPMAWEWAMKAVIDAWQKRWSASPKGRHTYKFIPSIKWGIENCDLSGSDLHNANLRGANLKDAAFELMLTPLHMSQTVR